MMLGVDTGLGAVIGFQIVGGTGVSLLFQAPSLAIQNNVSQADAATAMATLSFMRSLATALSTMIGGVVAGAFIKHRGMSKGHTETKTGIQNMTERNA